MGAPHRVTTDDLEMLRCFRFNGRRADANGFKDQITVQLSHTFRSRGFAAPGNYRWDAFNVMPWIKRMERRGLVVRTMDHDGKRGARMRELRLTPKARAILQAQDVAAIAGAFA